jgi:hypothetical protein
VREVAAGLEPQLVKDIIETYNTFLEANNECSDEEEEGEREKEKEQADKIVTEDWSIVVGMMLALGCDVDI